MRRSLRPPALLCAAALCAGALSACADTVQERPISHHVLEGLIAAPFPVYWLGISFRGMALTEATHDPGGAYSVQYGDCLRGGQGSCEQPLQIVTSPDNSFLPGASAGARAARVRGVRARVAQRGRTIVMPTGGVVVDVYAVDARTAAAAARALVPVNEPGAPEAPLPAALPDTGFDRTPLPSQLPAPLQPPR